MKIIQVNGIMCLSTHNGRELKTKYVKKKSEIKSRYTNKQTQYVKKKKKKLYIPIHQARTEPSTWEQVQDVEQGM